METEIAAPAAPATEKSGRNTTQMSKRHRETRAVTAYLTALRSRGHGAHPKVTADAAQRRLGAIQEKLKGDITEIERLMLIQRKLNNERIAAGSRNTDFEKLEREFAEVARSYSERMGIEKKAWQELHVPARVLLAARIR